MARIFISYAREDFKLVKELHQRLSDAEFIPWMDKVDLVAGQRWRPAIEQAIRKTDFFVLCLSNNSVKKRSFVQREIKMALDLWQEMLGDDIYLIPVLLEFVEPGEIPDSLREIGWVFLYEDDGWDDLMRALKVGTEQRSIKSQSPTTKSQPQVLPDEPKKTENQLPTPVSQLPTYDFTTVTLDSSGNIVRRPPGKARYFTEDSGGLDLEMTYVPGGSFYMGLNASEEEEVRKEIERYKGNVDWVKTEMPQHEVAVRPFFIGKFQITQAQWRTVARFPKVKIDLKLDPSHFKGDTLPVESISWDDAQEFCARLSRRTGKRYRLPTEAEWEYACRAGTLTPFAFGETITPEVVNYNGGYPYAKEKKGTDRSKTTPVGSLGVSNAFGLFDMHGNVWEWCEDVWHENYDNAPEDGSAWLSGGDSSFRVLRGGSWNVNGRSCRSSIRGWGQPGGFNVYIGVRVVMSARTL